MQYNARSCVGFCRLGSSDSQWIINDIQKYLIVLMQRLCDLTNNRIKQVSVIFTFLHLNLI
jgi:hypothetical protein